MSLLRMSLGSSASTAGSGLLGMINWVPDTFSGVLDFASSCPALDRAIAGWILGFRGVRGSSAIGSLPMSRPSELLRFCGLSMSSMGSAIVCFFDEDGPEKAVKGSVRWPPSGAYAFPLIGSSFVICTPRPRKSPGLNLKERKIETASLPIASKLCVATPNVALLLKVSHLPCPKCFAGSRGASRDLLIIFIVRCFPLTCSLSSRFSSSLHKSYTNSSASCWLMKRMPQLTSADTDFRGGCSPTSVRSIPRE
ncbi:hypothetical protein TPAR_00349 [Tolypocladium paradoxum]|uniref:Uncharacterized protein n=1 Tax=Tolypocladium paradoxum TaxID=94208 RepID=A0A2S4LAI7_9HYPO|nr:hypothetical protein TPAR_00349 [Tolypocladium paradoxum]